MAHLIGYLGGQLTHDNCLFDLTDLLDHSQAMQGVYTDDERQGKEEVPSWQIQGRQTA
jgi:hypothetical protein